MGNKRRLLGVRQILALVLAVVVTVSTMPVSAYAATDAVVTETVVENETDVPEESAAVTETEEVSDSEESGESVSVEESMPAETEIEESVVETTSIEVEDTASTEVESVEETTPAETESVEETATVEETETETETLTEEIVEETTTEEVLFESVIMKDVTKTPVIIKDSNNNYQLTATVHDDTVTQYAVITKYTDMGNSDAFAVTIPATVNYNGMEVKVTVIDKQVFYGQEDITTLYFEEGSELTTIEYKAFEGCKYLTYMDPFPETLTKIGCFAFGGCILLGSKDKDTNNVESPELILPSGLTTIGQESFRECNSYKKVYIPNTLTKVTNDAYGYSGPFGKCDNLTEIVFEDGITTIPQWLFFGNVSNSKTLSVEIPDSVTRIEQYAFYKNDQLVSVSFGENSQLTFIGPRAFQYCTNLGKLDKDGDILETPEIFLPSGLTSLGEESFQGCTALKKIVIPKSVTTIPIEHPNTTYGPFYKCDNLTDISFEDGITVIPSELFYGQIATTDKKISMVIPASVITINASAFKENPNIERITFEGNAELTSIGEGAFYNCASLAYFEFPEKLTSIGKNAFYQCTNLGTQNSSGVAIEPALISLPTGLTTLGKEAFYQCTSLEKVIIPKSVTSANGPFTGCSNLRDITFEEGITAIPANMFNGCIVSGEKVFSIVIPDTVETIGDKAFYNNTNLVSVSFGENSALTTIGVDAFCFCTNLGTYNSEGEKLDTPEIFLPSGLTTIGKNAFYQCTEVEKVVIPKSLTTVNTTTTGPFCQCSSLTNIVLEEGIRKIPARLFSGVIVSAATDEITGEYLHTISFTIPDSVVYIEEAAFKDLVNLKSVTFGENSGLKEIGNYAFYKTYELETFTLPDTVEKIGDYAFTYIMANEEETVYSKLREFNISDESALKEIGVCAFYKAKNLKYINLIDGIEVIGERAFAYIETMFTIDEEGKEVERPVLSLPKHLTTLGYRAFAGNKSIKEIFVPKSLSDYGRYSTESAGPFNFCSQLETVIFEEGTKTILSNLLAGAEGEVAEEGCSYVDIVLPDSVTHIESYAFNRNPYIRSVSCNETSKLNYIGMWGLARCANLKTVELPKSLKTIDQKAFKSDTSLESIVIPEYASLDIQAFAGCSKLEKVEFVVNNLNYDFPLSIKDEVFMDCKSLKEVNLGNHISSIPTGAFSGCSALEELVIPYGVKSVAKNVFYNCSSLRYLFIPSSVTEIKTSSSELAYCYEQGLKIYVEKGDSKAKEFATKNGWETEVGIYRTADEFPDPQLYLQMKDQRYDKNLDTRLTLRELEKIVDVDLSNLGIKDMTGTELFTSLESMNCSKNEIAKLDTSTWTKLKTLNCANNDIEDLDFTNNKVIETLDCSQNRILVFGLSGIESLKNVTLGSQSGNMYVEQDTYGRMVLPLPKEYPSYLQKAVSDISDIDALAPARDGIIWSEAYDVPDLVEYHYTTTFGENQTEAEAVVWVNIFNAGIEITSKEYADPVLRVKINEQVDTNKNGLISKTEERTCKELDVTGTDKTEGTEEAKIRDLTGIGRLFNLEKLICKNNILESLDLSNNVKLEELDCSKNSLTALSLVKNSALRIVNCNENKIKNINLSNNKALIELYCEANELAKLDLSENTQLEVLRCGINSMAALDLSNNEYVDALIGTQEFTFEREYVGDENADVYVRLSAYDEGFVSSNVSNVAVYVGDDKDTEGEYFTLTQEGFVVKPLVTKIAYNYTVPQAGDRALKVTVNLVDEITAPEEIILTDISTLRIDKFVDKIHTGEPTYQDIVIWDGEYMLREDLDYEVTYVSNINVGTATVIIQGIEDYSGVYEDTYEIIEAWDVTVSAIKDQTFQNKKIEPKVTVKLGKKTLRNGVDYEVEYLNNKDTGVATALIKGKGKTYGEAGMKAVTFNIVECKISKASFKIGKVEYNGMAQQPEVVGEHSKAYLKEGEDFLVVYSKNINAGKGTATITGIGNYTGTVKKTFVIDKIDIAKLKDEDIVVSDSAKFSMTGAKADVSIKSGDYVLVEGKDYTLSYSKNKAIGKAKVTIKGKGNCKNGDVRYFDVKAQSIADPSITIDVAIAQVDSKGRTVKPKVTVMQDKKKLSEGERKDYVVVYDKDATKEADAYTITIYGRNRFGGSEEGVEKEFIIVDKLINKAKIKGLQNWQYDGTEKEQLEKMVEVVVGKEEVPSYCYDISYDNNVNVGNSATIIITANPEDCDYAYGGTVSAKFKITPVKFSPSKGEFRVTADFEDIDYDDELEAYVMPYSGKALEPKIVVYDEELGVALEEGKDYKLSYKNNVKVGKSAMVTITGTKNYTGSVKLNFSIVPKDMYENTDDFKVIVKNSAYTGKVIKPRITVKDGDITLKQNTDYTVNVEQVIETEGFDGKIKNKGKYIITIVGKGNYTNELDDRYYLSVY